MNHQGPVNVLRRGPIISYPINYDQHKNFYDSYDEGKIVDMFFNSVKDLFVSGKDCKIQGYLESKLLSLKIPGIGLQMYLLGDTSMRSTNVFVGDTSMSSLEVK